MKMEIEVVFDEGRLVQLFPYGDKNEEHCVHGIKLRWSCDDCDEHTDSLPVESLKEVL